MEVSALKYPAGVGRYGRSPLLRIQSDEHLIKLIRAGHDGAFEALVGRYNTRLLSFCRHLLGSREDAEDVLQEAFSAAYHAILADDRPIHVRPWLYRIARNRCLNHLRRVPAVPTDAMDVMYAENGETTADKVHRREEFRLLVGDIHELAETQRTALLLREMEALSYEQIAEAMETTVSSVKSLLVRARVSLAEASEARLLSCEDIRSELAEVSEGLTKRPNALVRRHLKHCERCVGFNQQLKRTNRALGALLPVGPLALLKGGFFHLTSHAGHGAATVTGSSATAGAGSSVAGSGAAASVAGAGASSGAVGAAASSGSSLVSAGIGALATKTAAGLAVAAVFTAGVAVSHRPSPIAHKAQVNASHARSGHTRAVALASRASATKVSSRENRLSAKSAALAGGTHAGSPFAPTTGLTPAGSSASAGHRAGTGTPSAAAGPASSAPASAVTSAGSATTASSTAATAGSPAALPSSGSSSSSKRHGTTISSPGNSGNSTSAGAGNILPLGALTPSSPTPPSTSTSTPTVPGTGASNSTPSPLPPASSTDSGDSGPVASGVTAIVSSVTGGSSSTPGS
jgi:RNA polymerase sigma factor (sigma-70 family)